MVFVLVIDDEYTNFNMIDVYNIGAILVCMVLCHLGSAFEFMSPVIALNSLTINTPTTYTFTIFRTFDDELNPTLWKSEPVTAATTINIKFPQQYQTLAQAGTPIQCVVLIVNDAEVVGPYTCTETGSAGNKQIDIVGAFPTSIAMANATISINNILNASPAATTGTFGVKIGNDVSGNARTVTLEAAAFSSCKVEFDPQFVNTTASMVIKIGLKNAIPSDGNIEIKFPPSLQWQRDISTAHILPLASTTCSVLDDGSGGTLIDSVSCEGSASQQTIKISYQFKANAPQQQLTGTVSFSIAGLFSPPTTEPIDKLSISSQTSAGSTIDKCSQSISNLQPKTMTMTLVPTSSPLQVNSLTGLTVNFVLADTIDKNDYFLIEFPDGSFVNYLFKTSSLSLSTTTIYDSVENSLKFTQSNSNGLSFAQEAEFIRFLQYRSSHSTRTTAQFRFLVMSSTNYQKMQGFSTLTAVGRTVSMTVSALSLQVSQVTNYTLTCTLTDPLSSDARIVITLPDELALQDGSMSSCPSLGPSSTISSSPSCQVAGNQIVLTTLNASLSDIAAQTYTILIPNVVNHFAASKTGNFVAKFYYTSDVVDLVASSTGDVTMTPGLATLHSLALSNQTTNADSVSYTVTASLPHGVPSVNGFLQLSFSDSPVFNNIQTISLQLGSPPTSHTLAASRVPATTTSISISLGNLKIPAGSNITLLLSNVRNEAFTAPIKVAIASKISTRALVDQSVDFVYNDLVPMNFKAITLTRVSAENFKSTVYTFSVSLGLEQSQYEARSVLLVEFPPSTSVQKVTCTDSASTALICKLVVPRSIQIDLDGLPNNTTSNADIVWQFSISNVVNPFSYQPSEAFNFKMQTSEGHQYAIDRADNVKVTNSIPASFESLSWVFQPMLFGSKKTNLTFTPKFLTTNIGRITLDVGNFSVEAEGANINCASAQVKINCSFNSPLVSIAPEQSPFNVIELNIEVNNLFLTPNGPSDTPIPVLAYDTGSTYLVHSSQPQGLLFRPNCDEKCATCPEDAPATCLTCYQNTLVSSLNYYYSSSCFTECPSKTFHNQSITDRLVCSDCSTGCKQCATSAIFCTSCSNATYLHSISTEALNVSTCVSECPDGFFQNQTAQACEACQSPCRTCNTSATDCLACLTDFFAHTNATTSKLECVGECPPNLTVPVTDQNGVKICEYCVTSCATCVSLASNCSSCATGFFLLLDNATKGSSCVQQCPQGYISVDNETCSPCMSPCKNCVTSVNTCVSCIDDYFLSAAGGSTCLQTCALMSFGNSTAAVPYCQLCSSIPALNCYNCSSVSTCYECDDPSKLQYVFYPPDQTCLPEAPAGFANVSGIANECTHSCTLCEQATDNCTGCSGIFNFFEDEEGKGFCLEVCPATYLGLANLCKKCQSPCLLCTISVDNCLSCLDQFFLSEAKCLPADQCPDFTYPNDTAKVCDSCAQPCVLCSNSTFCLSCFTNLSLSIDSGECTQSCPTGQISLADTIISKERRNVSTLICRDCLSPCATCVDTRVKCVRCIANFYHYPEIQRCYETCPSLITVPKEATSTASRLCEQCESPCRTCSNTPQTCLSCDQNNYLETATPVCVTSCSAGSYGELGLCKTCLAPCLTCSSLSVCLTCRTGFLYQGSCVQICPSSRGVIINNECSRCPNGCSSCTQAQTVEDSKCSACTATSIYFNQSCLSECPQQLNMHLNESDNKFYCLTDKQLAKVSLVSVLSFSELLPLPFTILALFFSIASFMSKLQNKSTYTIGLLYCWWGVLEIASFLYLVFGVYFRVDGKAQHIAEYEQSTARMGIITLAVAFILNFMALLTQTPYLLHDTKFNSWLSHSEPGTTGNQIANAERMQHPGEEQDMECFSHKCSFYFLSGFSLLTSFKLKMLLFTKLFKFATLSATLESVQKFNIFNLFSFFGILYEGVSMYTVYIIIKSTSYAQNRLLFLACIDVIIITGICMILAFISIKKDKNFFEQADEESTDSDGLSSRRKKNLPSSRQNKVGSKFQGNDSQGRLLPRQVGAHDEKVISDEEVSLNVSEDEAPPVGAANGARKQNWIRKEKGFDSGSISEEDEVKSQKTDRKPSAKPPKKSKISRNHVYEDSKASRLRKTTPSKESGKGWVEISHKKNADLENGKLASPVKRVQEQGGDSSQFSPTKGQYSNILYKKGGPNKGEGIVNQHLGLVTRNAQLKAEEEEVEESIQLERPKNRTYVDGNKDHAIGDGFRDHAILMKDYNQKSFEQILPFVHRDGEFVYQPPAVKGNNIFDKDQSEEEDSPKKFEEEDEIEVVHLDRSVPTHKVTARPAKVETGMGTEAAEDKRSPHLIDQQNQILGSSAEPTRANLIPNKYEADRTESRSKSQHLTVTRIEKVPFRADSHNGRGLGQEEQQQQIQEVQLEKCGPNMHNGQTDSHEHPNNLHSGNSQNNAWSPASNKPCIQAQGQSNGQGIPLSTQRKKGGNGEGHSQEVEKQEMEDEERGQFDGQEQEWLRGRVEEEEEVAEVIDRPVQRSSSRKKPHKDVVYRSKKDLKVIEANDEDFLQEKIKEKSIMLNEMRKNNQSNSRQRHAEADSSKNTKKVTITQDLQSREEKDNEDFLANDHLQEKSAQKKPIGKLVRKKIHASEHNSQTDRPEFHEDKQTKEKEHQNNILESREAEQPHQDSAEKGEFGEERDEAGEYGEAREAREDGEAREAGKAREARETGEAGEAQQTGEAREAKEARETGEAGETGEAQEAGEAREARETGEAGETESENGQKGRQESQNGGSHQRAVQEKGGRGLEASKEEAGSDSGQAQIKNISSESFHPSNPSFEKKQFRDKPPMISFDESSLRRSQMEESVEKLSNPFEMERSEEQGLGAVEESQQEPVQSAEDDEHVLMSPDSRHSPLGQDDTVPIESLNLQKRFYNPITEQNSQTEQVSQNDVTKKVFDYETDNQMFEDDRNGQNQGRQARYESERESGKVHSGDHLQSDLVSMLERGRTSLPRNMRKKKPMPQEDQEEATNIKGFRHVKEPNVQSEEMLAKKSALDSPLKRGACPDRRVMDSGDTDSDEEQKMGRESKPTFNRQSRMQGESVEGEPASTGGRGPPPKMSSDAQMPGRDKPIPKLANFDSKADLIKWNDQFAFQNQSHLQFPDEEMQTPQQPRISQRRSRRNSRSGRQFSYEEVDKSYHRGRLFDYESSGAYKQSTSQSRSRKSKSKGDGKTARSSLQKIYMQKLDRK